MDQIYYGEIMRKIGSFLFIISIVFAQDWAGQSGGFLRMGITARSMAMGGGFTAELDRSFAAFHNPAWTAFLVKRHLGSECESVPHNGL